MIYKGNQDEYFELETVDANNYRSYGTTMPGTLQLMWFITDGNKLTIDGVPYVFDMNQVITLSPYHRVEYEALYGMKLLRFNREFYCVLDHDSEVGCKGLLYYAAAKIPLITPDGMELEILEAAWKLASLEFEMKDDLQLEMLQMMLKRILIVCTRIYKRQGAMAGLNDDQHEFLRQFTFLVEKHFKEKHSVAEYAELLYKSPKTLTNTLHKIGEKSPLMIIQDRIMLEAKRLLHYTKKDISEIGYELGFPDIQAFSRFFKTHAGQAASEYREMAA